jgi:putative phosphoesterase
MTRIAILGDTHITYFKDLPKFILKEVEEADWVIHAGDYNHLDVFNGFIKIKGDYFKGVYGNADPSYIREKIPSKEIIEILGKKIGITHPASGGSSVFIEEKVLNEFKNDNVDIIIFGHTHESKIQYKENVLLINPGKGYLETTYFGPPTTIAILEIDDKIQAKIKKIVS